MPDDTLKEILIARREGLKLFFDVFKHLTTLSSGSILLVVTLLGRQDAQLTARWLMAVSFLGFLLSTTASIIVMLSTARTIRREDRTDKLPDATGNIAYFLSVVGFGTGVICLSTFGYLNL